MNPADDLLFAPKKARVEIIPLIDVIFFLLATFVLFTLSLQKLEMIEGELPRVPAGPAPEVETTVFLQVTEGALYWKLGSRGLPEMIANGELPARLASYRQSVADPRVMIRSDGKVKLGVAVAVLDQVRLAKIAHVAFETIPSAPGS